MTDLSGALDAFDRTEANLVRLEEVWKRLQTLYSTGISFGNDTPEFDEVLESFRALTAAMPAIDDYRLECEPMSPDALAQDRLDAQEIGSIEAIRAVEEGVLQPEREIAAYRRKLASARRQLIRDRALSAVAAIDEVLKDVVVEEFGAAWRESSRWSELQGLVSELARLTAGANLGASRWSDLNRHLHFAQANDLHDIITMDWPSVRAVVEDALYGGHEPLPVGVDDLGQIVSAAPRGAVSTKLDWSRLNAEEFEDLVFALVNNASGYENANWLMRTHAADRGRDIEVYRVIADPLGHTRRRRVIIQCKHWQTKSVNRDDLVLCTEAVTLWEGERVDTVIIATSGRFTQDAVELYEKRERERSVPSVELWPDNHLELLVTRRPHIAAAFGLR